MTPTTLPPALWRHARAAAAHGWDIRIAQRRRDLALVLWRTGTEIALTWWYDAHDTWQPHPAATVTMRGEARTVDPAHLEVWLARPEELAGVGRA